MPNFYLQPKSYEKLFFELHATTEISVSFPSKLTSYPIETGQEVTDNIVLEPITVSFSGIITDVGSFSSIGRNAADDAITNNDNNTLLSIEDYIFYLRKLRSEKEVFAVWFSERISGIDFIDSAILTTFDLSKTTEIGSSWNVKIGLTEVRFANKAEVTSEPNADWRDRLATNKEASASTGGVTNPQKETTIQGLISSRNYSADGTKLSGKYTGGVLFE